MSQPNIIVSFLHGYEDLKLNIPGEQRPALWKLDNDNENKVFSYYFPRNPQDFKQVMNVFEGVKPLSNAKDFKKLPRFGFTGLQKFNNNIYAGSWNSIYEIDDKTYSLKTIISNQLMHNIHGLHVDENGIIYSLSSKDTVVHCDFNGNIINHLSIGNDLNVRHLPELEKIDWRFLSKMHQGSSGYWHINHVQRFGNEIYLTSRTTSCFIVLNLITQKAYLRTMNFFTPNLIHDGLSYKSNYYFTSIDGKIIIAKEAGDSTWDVQKEIANEIFLFNRDLVTKVIRLEETSLGRKPNWCRGIACINDRIYVTIDGRYDTDLSFGLLELDINGTIYSNQRLKWSEIADESKIRYVTGFGILDV